MEIPCRLSCLLSNEVHADMTSLRGSGSLIEPEPRFLLSLDDFREISCPQPSTSTLICSSGWLARAAELVEIISAQIEIASAQLSQQLWVVFFNDQFQRKAGVTKMSC